MVIRVPIKPNKITKFVKPYLLKVNFTNEYVNAQVIHTPTSTVACAASTQEKCLKLKGSNGDVTAAAIIGKLLGERLLLKDITVVSVSLTKDQMCHGKVKAVIDSLKEVGVKLV